MESPVWVSESRAQVSSLLTTQRVVAGPAAQASSGRLLEMPVFRPLPEVYLFTRCPGDARACWQWEE